MSNWSLVTPRSVSLKSYVGDDQPMAPNFFLSISNAWKSVHPKSKVLKVSGFFALSSYSSSYWFQALSIICLTSPVDSTVILTLCCRIETGKSGVEEVVKKSLNSPLTSCELRFSTILFNDAIHDSYT